MASPIGNREDKLNPGQQDADQLLNGSHESISGYDRGSDGLDDHPVSGGDSNGDSGRSKQAKALRDAESNTTTGSSAGIAVNGVLGAEQNLHISNFTGSNNNVKISSRKKGPLVSIILIILSFFGFGTFYFGAMLGPIAFVENTLGDLSDSLITVDQAGLHLFRNKIPTKDVNKVVTGCSKLSIRCKFKTLSSKQVVKLERAGITVNASKTKIFGRVVPESYTFQNKTITDPAEFRSQLRARGSPLTNAYRSSLNPKFMVLSDKTFLGKVLKTFGVSKAKPGLKGSSLDRANQLMTAARVNDPKDISFKTLKDADNEPVLDSNRKPLSVIEGDSSGTVYTEAEVTKAKVHIERIVKTPPLSKLKVGTIGALSALGITDLACTLNNTIGLASVAAKVANKRELIKYGMPILATVSALKAGDPSVTAEDAEAVGKFFMDTDNRQYIPSISKTISDNGLDKSAGASVSSLGYVENPNYGKNALDSELYKMSAGGAVASPDPSRASFALGLGPGALLGGVENFAAIMSTIINVGGNNKEVCHVVQNGFVRFVGLATGIVISAVPVAGQAKLIGQVALAAGMMAGIVIVDQILNNALKGSIVPDDIQDAPVERGDMLWTSLAAINEENSRVRGLIPASSSEYATYNQQSYITKQFYNQLESKDVNPFDASNPNSFIGSLATNISTSVSGSGLSWLGNILSSGLSGIAKTNLGLAGATSFSPERLQQCDDAAYQELGLDPDVQCNLRFYSPEEDLNLMEDPDAVAAYMEDNGYVAKDTVTGLPDGYTPPSDRPGKNMGEQLLDGIKGQFVSTVDIDISNNYENYLEYCAYRQMPFGETYEESPIDGSGSDWINGKKCLEVNSELSHFRAYTALVSTQAAEDEEPLDNSTQQTSNASVLPTGTVKTLSKGIINTGKIHDVTGQIKRLSTGLTPVSGVEVDTKILGLLLALANNSNSFTVSSLARNYIPTNGSSTSWHLSGRAVDISGSVGINGKPFGYSGFRQDIQDYINQAAALLPDNCQIGLPNQQYVTATKKIKPKCAVFSDIGTGAHIHFGVPG